MMQNLSMRNVNDTIVAFMLKGQSQAECVAWLITRGWSRPAATHFVDRIGRQIEYGKRAQQASVPNLTSRILWLTAALGLASVAYSLISALI